MSLTPKYPPNDPAVKKRISNLSGQSARFNKLVKEKGLKVWPLNKEHKVITALDVEIFSAKWLNFLISL
ncbi:hypothetical protein swp_4667 [Shewanella piezotolerans WP3]|uniref:Uncharacterized protein n=1 Tax=Shewanella piezotolerans (strain WP3 / JCM 13877) TaxID=225849 RepID=B8CTQ9_SHEPW|nr:hypothetical protein swp_4667 [Shewanella piezotolerans WP3]